MPTQATSSGIVFPDSTTQTSAAALGLGNSQSWTDVTGSRALSTNYTNSTGKPIQLCVRCNLSGNAVTNVTINGVTWTAQTYSAPNSCSVPIWFIVQAGATYQVAKGGGTTMVISQWMELR